MEIDAFRDCFSLKGRLKNEIKIFLRVVKITYNSFIKSIRNIPNVDFF